MKKNIYLCIIIFVQIFIFSINKHDINNKILFKEEFENLNNWENMCLPGTICIKKYDIEKSQNENYLRLDTDSSVTGLINKKIFNPYEFPIIKWRWKIENIFNNGDGEYKNSDDYPVRLFILFKKEKSNNEKLKNFFKSIIKKKYGLYPPHSSIVFVWESKVKNKEFIVCPYSKIIRYIPVQMGSNNVKKWIIEEKNIIESYKLAFNKYPPENAVIALMADSDNIKERSTAYIDFIEISK